MLYTIYYHLSLQTCAIQFTRLELMHSMRSFPSLKLSGNSAPGKPAATLRGPGIPGYVRNGRITNY